MMNSHFGSLLNAASLIAGMRLIAQREGERNVNGRPSRLVLSS